MPVGIFVVHGKCCRSRQALPRATDGVLEGFDLQFAGLVGLDVHAWRDEV